MSHSSTKTLKRSSGFTLIELLVSMTISLAVLAAVAKTFTVQTRQNGAEEQIAPNAAKRPRSLGFDGP
jgi:prepilin-type N-terminal cleavage/methylation domain-containing protein